MDDRLPSLDSTTMSWNDDQRDERHGHSRGLLELLSTAPIRAHTQDDSYGPLGNDFNSNSGSVKAGRQIYQPDSFQLNTPASLDGAQFTATFKHPKSIYGDAVSSESERLRLQLKIAELTEENLRLSIENLQLREENRQIRENSREAAQVIEDLKSRVPPCHAIREPGPKTNSKPTHGHMAKSKSIPNNRQGRRNVAPRFLQSIVNPQGVDTSRLTRVSPPAIESYQFVQPKLVHKHREGKVKPERYGGNREWDLGLCFAAFFVNTGCPYKDTECDWRHDWLRESEEEYIRKMGFERFIATCRNVSQSRRSYFQKAINCAKVPSL